MEKNDEYDFQDENQKKPNQSVFNMNFKLPFRNKVILTIAYFVLVALYIIFANPMLNMHFSAGIMNVSIFLLVLIFIWINDIKLVSKLLALVIFVIIGINIYSSPIINSEKYYNLIGDVTEKSYEEEKPNIDNTKVPVVDKELAEKLGDKVLGDDIGLGSQYTVGEYYFISTADDLAWVAPLEPQSFFKWLQNRDGAPGYVYVSATDPNDVRLVKDVNGEELKIKYTNDSYFFSQIKRHTYLNKNMFRAMTDFSFEIDDEGMPYWVITTYVPTIGFSGYDTDGVIIVNAQTGEVEYYDDINDAPDWAERIQPTAIVNQQIQDWGAYKNGWLNTIFAQSEMIKPTEGFGYVYIDGEPYYYTGLTSIKSDKSTVGFMLVNTRTKENTFYKINGATEDAAQSSAEGQVQQYEYTASFPILLNVYNTPTYFMTLKDSDGLIKQYAYVSVKNYNIVGVGDTKSSAEASYYTALKNNGTVTEDVDEANLIKTTGKIERINKIDSIYYIKLEDQKELFTIESDKSIYLPYTIKGDNVTLEYNKSEEDYQTIVNFTNNDLK